MRDCLSSRSAAMVRPSTDRSCGTRPAPAGRHAGSVTARTAPHPPPELGAREVAGYRVLRSLARDEQAEVLLGHRIADDGARTVAIKTWPVSDENWSVALQSCAALDRSRGDHVVELWDLDSDDQAIRLIFERLPRGDLAELLRTRARLDAGEAVTLLAPIVTALLRLHRAGVAHGGVGPATVLFRDDGSPTLIGFSRAELFPPDAPEVVLEQVEAVRRDRVAARVVATSVLARVEGARAHAARALMADIGGCSDELVLPLLGSRLFELATALPVRFGADDEEPEIAPSQWRPIPVGDPVGGIAGEPDPGGIRQPRSGRVVAALARVVPERVLARMEAAIGRSAAVAAIAKAVRAGLGRWRSWTPGRRRVAVAIAAAATTIGLVTAVVPAGTAAPAHPAAGLATAEPSDGAPSGSRTAAAGGPDADGPDAGTSGAGTPGAGTSGADRSAADDPLVAASWLVTARDRCLGTLSARCLDEVDEPHSGALRDDQAAIAAAKRGGELPDALASGESSAVLIERLGDSALVGLGEAESGVTLLLVRLDGAWRIRDVLHAGATPSDSPTAAPISG